MPAAQRFSSLSNPAARMAANNLPCTDAIIASGIRRVCGSGEGPANPAHGGKGFEILKRAGIVVDTGLLSEEAAGFKRNI